MLLILGNSALSKASLTKLKQQFKTNGCELSQLSAKYVHVVDVEADSLDKQQQEVLHSILEYGVHEGNSANAGHKIYALPRMGTISPWSTKATDIAHICGLNKISRIERGIQFSLDASVKKADIEKHLDLLHDKMVEQIFYEEADCDQLFSHHTPKPLSHVDILGLGTSALETANVKLGLALSPDESSNKLSSIRA
jgi:phosphoribosylformylglycinamidine synthase